MIYHRRALKTDAAVPQKGKAKFQRTWLMGRELKRATSVQLYKPTHRYVEGMKG